MLVEETEVYRDWINSLKDLPARARIQVRVDTGWSMGIPAPTDVSLAVCPN